MKAIVLKSFGGPESFELCDVPTPVPDVGHVLVRVHATNGVQGKLAIAVDRRISESME
jgi:NADPH:quinone reductase-like Zn-dependent oxidoreductase